MRRLFVCLLDEVLPGKPNLFHLPDTRSVVLFTTSSGIIAVENRCPHAGGMLDNGIVQGDHLTCVWHGWKFDLLSGKCRNHERAVLLQIPVEIIENQVFIHLDDLMTGA